MKVLTVSARFSSKILGLALLGLAVVGGCLRIAAQTAPASPAPAATAAPAPEPAKPEAASSEDAQTAAFRLEGPLVKSASKALHLSPETTARSFEILNFLIVALALGIPLARFIPKAFRKRAEGVRTSIETARKVTEDANARLSAIEAKLAGLDGEIAQIRAQVEQESLQDEVRIKSTIEEESARIVASAEQEINVAAAQARRGLRNFAADLAIEQATKQLVLTPETDRALIAEFLADASLTGTARGGQN